MQDNKRYAVGVDVGSASVKVAVALVDEDEKITIIGAAQRPVSGMRKGNIVNPNAVAEAIDKALIDAQHMSGHYIESASVSINGSHIAGVMSNGVISITGREITVDDLLRAEDTARIVSLPANRSILDVLPQNYTLDSQVNIKNPLGMVGTRLEINAYITTALTPHLDTLIKTMGMANLQPNNIEIAGLAAAKLVLAEKQREHGVALVDIGAATTNVVVFEEGDLIHAAIIPVGGNNITNDLAVYLPADMDVAETLKLKHAYAAQNLRAKAEVVHVKTEDEALDFDSRKVDMVVEARVEAIFGLVNDELKKVDRFAKLPGGVIITGGSAKLSGIVETAKKTLRLNTKIAHVPKFAGITDKIMNTKFTTCLGLMLIDAESRPQSKQKTQIMNKFFPKKKKK
ncbi:cell division protein FtsA [Candidatus Saccharibacteria bacterium]|nr:cell division protein FtsA [Candidatus Saccharibacteria bacterium]